LLIGKNPNLIPECRTTLFAYFSVSAAPTSCSQLFVSSLASSSFSAATTNYSTRAGISQTLKADRIPFIRFIQWWVPSVEFFGGIAITVGLLTVPAAIALVILLAVAMVGRL
jgi:uncharacterized membrane protein YphA (DoxX/SURF4 family)